MWHKAGGSPIRQPAATPGYLSGLRYMPSWISDRMRQSRMRRR
jgi:hypothetical protein